MRWTDDGLGVHGDVTSPGHGLANTRERLRTLYGDRANDLDLRIGKIIKIGRTRSNFALDIVNVFNSDAVLTYNSLLGTYSASGAFTPNATWPTPTAVLQARLARISVTFDW